MGMFGNCLNLKRVIDVGPEWRSFANDGNSIHKDRSRGGYAEVIKF